ncbi:MAG: class I SAM-dependent methyltransferase [Caulobacteraceae bacterium]|nr:class I SAM-dependent methyltransferase [Caulobacteraceae bacterium]
MANTRNADGSAGDADYGTIGAGYARFRQPDPRIAALIRAELGGVASVLNVGAGAGSYEPQDLQVVAVEPSETMRAQRPSHLAAAVGGRAEALPFKDNSFDAAMALVTVHQWSDLRAGLREMRRVARGPVLVMTADPQALGRFWLSRYAPEAISVEAKRMPAPEQVLEGLGGDGDIIHVPIPLDCRDGFNEAYYGRPECLLNPAARQACSSWSFIGAAATERFEAALRADLASGAWDAEWGSLRPTPQFEGSLRLVISRPS